MMKNLKLLLLSTVSICLLFACEKEPLEPSSDTNAISKEQANQPKSGEVTYIDEANFEEEFDVFAEDFFTNTPYGMIEITYLEASAQYALTTEDPGPIDPVSSERIVCRGEKSNVVACAQRFVRFNIFGCHATVSHYSGNTWIATEVCD